MITPEKCSLCNGPVVFTARQAGYMKPDCFDIYRCQTCGVAFPWPQRDDSPVYDAIYRRAAEIPGYARYERYAREVLRVSDAMCYLAEQEDAYWAVEQTLPKIKGNILEVGCGLGYLTYALRRRGYTATGIDLSAVAIQQATERYGACYVTGRVEQLAAEDEARFGAVILTEVIEHVLKPWELLCAVARVVAPGGLILLSTPNKTAYAPDAAWVSDCPPVHQWWFSEQSIEMLADSVGWVASFIDFTAYNRTHYVRQSGSYLRPFVVPARLEEDGRVNPEATAARRGSGWLYRCRSALQHSSRVQELRARWLGEYQLSSRRPTMGVILQRKAKAKDVPARSNR